MIECSQCGKELEREVFCSPKCKMRWHRKAPIKKTARKTQEAKILETDNVVPAAPSKRHGKMCKHGKRFCGICNIKKPAIKIHGNRNQG